MNFASIQQPKMTKYIQDKIREIAIILFEFDYDMYLASKNDRILICVFLNSNGEIVQTDADFPENILDDFRQNGFKVKMAYGIANNVPVEDKDFNADFILISEEFLEESIVNIDSLLIHELCHCVIQSNIQIRCSKEISDSAKQLGTWLYDCTNKEIDLIHTLKFCQLLACVVEKEKINEILPGSFKEIIKLAMRYDALFE